MSEDIWEGEETPPPSFLYDLPYLLVPDDGRWREKGVCKGRTETTRLFFGELPDGSVPRGSGLIKARITAEAMKLCAVCTVRKECFAFAKNNKIGHGVWGGVDFSFSRKKGEKTKKQYIPDSVE